jgi:hypothetical protein
MRRCPSDQVLIYLHWISSCCMEFGMRRSSWTPAIVPYGADQTVYLVVDRFGGLSGVYSESEVERTDLETIITDLMSDNSTSRSGLSPSTHSIGHGTHRKISSSKSKPAAAFEARASRAYQKISSPTTPVQAGSWPCGRYNPSGGEEAI